MALRAALFPAKKDAQRPSKYPVNDGINYTRIEFPTPVKQIDRLEEKNRNLAINVFGWGNGNLIKHKLSRKESNRDETVKQISLMLIEWGEKQHYCYVKRVNALLFDQAKNSNAKHYCFTCMSGFTR